MVSTLEPKILPCFWTAFTMSLRRQEYLKAATHGHAVYPVSSTKLIRWIRRGLASEELATMHGVELLIAFEDLVSMRVIAALRSVGVSWLEIKKTETVVTGMKLEFNAHSPRRSYGQVRV